jgi:replicative DNA helicase
MENQILSAVLQSRECYELFAKHLNPKRWSREFQIVFGYVSDYYSRDPEATEINLEILGEIVSGSVQNEKHAEKFLTYIKEAATAEHSTANITEAVLIAKRNELALALALAITNGKDHVDLLEEYNGVLAMESLEASQDSGIETYTDADMESLLLEEKDRTGVVPIYPKALMERLDGGLKGSDHMIIIARPEAGKTALILTIVCAIARAGMRVVVFNNEERISRLYIRAISCITGLSVNEVRNNIYAAKDLALERGFSNIVFVAMSPGSPQQIDEELEKYPDAVAFVVDQLRNLTVRSENKTQQLEEAAKSIRNIAKRRNLVAISVTQAGDSAEGKSVLGMGDVDSSNTGIPGACDVLLGVGANEQQKAEGVRIFTPIKNKITGDHEPFPTRINPIISKYVSI